MYVLYHSLNRLVALNTNTPYAEVARRFFQRVSMDLQRANHRAFGRRSCVGGVGDKAMGARVLKWAGLLEEPKEENV